jgi:hypothetical protein
VGHPSERLKTSRRRGLWVLRKSRLAESNRQFSPPAAIMPLTISDFIALHL